MEVDLPLKDVFHLNTSLMHTLANPRLNSSSVSYSIKTTKPHGHGTSFIAQEEAKKKQVSFAERSQPLVLQLQMDFFSSVNTNHFCDSPACAARYVPCD